MQRFHFNTRVRTKGESIITYVAALWKLAEHCNYGDSLNEMIRDRLVCGVEQDVIQTHLLAERDLTFEKALENAKTVDSILIGYSDADCPDDRHSTTCNLFLMAGGTISWTSKKQATVSLSTAEAEYISLSTATQEAIWLLDYSQTSMMSRVHPL